MVAASDARNVTALAVREAHGRPALFRMYDEAVEALR